MTLRALAIPGATFVLATLLLGGLFWTQGASPLERFAPRGSDGWQAVALLALVASLMVLVVGFVTHAIASVFLHSYVRRSRRLRKDLAAACAAGLAPHVPTPGNAPQSILFHASIAAYLHQHGAPALARFLRRGLSSCRVALASALALLLASLACTALVQRALDLRVPLPVRWEVVAASVMVVALVLVVTAALGFVEHFATLLAWLRERARREMGIATNPQAFLAASLPEDFRSVRRGALAYVWALVAASVVGLWCWGLWWAHSPVAWLVWIGALASFATFLATFSLSWRRIDEATRASVPSSAHASPAPSAPPAPPAPSAQAANGDAAAYRRPVRGDMPEEPEPGPEPVSPALIAMVASQPHVERPPAPKKDPFEQLAKRTRGSEQWLEMHADELESARRAAEAEARAPRRKPEPLPEPEPAREREPEVDIPRNASPAPSADVAARAAPPPAPQSPSSQSGARKGREDVRSAVLRRLAQEGPRRQAPAPPSSAPSDASDDDSGPNAPNAPSAPNASAHAGPNGNGNAHANGADAPTAGHLLAPPPVRETARLRTPQGLSATTAIAPGYVIEDEVALQGIGSEDPFAWAAFGLLAPRVALFAVDEPDAPPAPVADAAAAPRVATALSAPAEIPPQLPGDDLRVREVRAPAPPRADRDSERDPGTLLY